MATPLSAVIITFNAAAQLEDCLKSVSFADEIVVVDSGSSDTTVALAKGHGAGVLNHPWSGFGPQKQFAVMAARNPWVLCIDADERVSPELRTSIERELAAPRHFAYAMPRRNRFMGRWLRHGEGYPDLSLRLFHREHARWSDDAVHEKVITQGSVGRLQGDLLHESEVGIARYLDKQNDYTTLQAQRLFEQGKRAGLLQLLFNPLVRFIKFYVLRAGFLDGVPGLVHITIGCYNTFLKYAKLIEIRQRDKG